MSALLEKYSQYLKAGHAGGVAALFAEDGEFYDDAPIALGFQAINVKGRPNIEEFFRETFKRGGLQLANVAINGNPCGRKEALTLRRPQGDKPQRESTEV